MQVLVPTSAGDSLVGETTSLGTGLDTEDTYDWFDNAFQSRLNEDLDVNCDATAAARFGLVVPILLVLSLGGPLLAMYCTCQNIKRSRTDNYRLSYLLASYRQGAPFWEAINMLRRGLLAVCMAALHRAGSSAQVAAALVLVIANLNSVGIYQPMRSLLQNRLEQVSSVVLLLTLLPIVALPNDFQQTLSQGEQATLNDFGGGEHIREVMGHIVLGLNAFFLAIALLLACYGALPGDITSSIAQTLGEDDSSDEDATLAHLGIGAKQIDNVRCTFTCCFRRSFRWTIASCCCKCISLGRTGCAVDADEFCCYDLAVAR